VNIVAVVGVSEAGVNFTADKVGEDIGIQIDASGEFTSLAGVQVQFDVEVAVTTTAQLAIILVGALCRAGYLYIDVSQRTRSVISDAYEELTVGLLAGEDVGHCQISIELTVVATWLARSTWFTAALSFEVLIVEVIAAIGVIEADFDFAANLIFIDIGIQVETGSKGLRLTRVHVQGDAKMTLLAGTHFSTIDILAIVAAENVDMHVVQRTRSVVGDAHVELAVGLVAREYVGHGHIGGEGSGRSSCDGAY